MAAAHLNDKSDGWWDDLLPNINLKVEIFASNCSRSVGINAALDIVTRGTIYFIVGPSCSSAAVTVSLVGSIFEVPIISPSATSPELSNKATYKYFSRTVPSDQFQGTVLADLANHHNWKKFAVMNTDDPYGRGVSSVLVEKSLNVYNTSSENVLEILLASDSSGIVEQLKTLQSASMNVLFLICLETEAITVISEAKKLGLLSGGMQIIGAEGMANNLLLTHSNFSEVESVSYGMLGVTPLQNSSLTEKYTSEWAHLSPTTYPSLSADRSEIVDYGLSNYDSFLAVAMAIDSISKKNLPITNKTLNLEEIRNVNYEGLSGKIVLDANGDTTKGLYIVTNVQNINGRPKWVTIGSWSQDSNITVDSMKVLYQSRNPRIPVVDGLCPNDCRGNGICDTSTGKCGCHTGYIELDCWKTEPRNLNPFETHTSNSFCKTMVYYTFKADRLDASYTIKFRTGVNPVTGEHDAIAILTLGTYVNKTANFSLTPQLSSTDTSVQELKVSTFANSSTGPGTYFLSVYGVGTACPSSFIIELVRESELDNLSKCKRGLVEGTLLYEDPSKAWDVSNGGTVYTCVFCVILGVVLLGTWLKAFIIAVKTSSGSAMNILNKASESNILLIKRNVIHWIILTCFGIQYLQVMFLAVSADTEFSALEDYRIVLGYISLVEIDFAIYIWVLYIICCLWIFCLLCMKGPLRPFVMKSPKWRSSLLYIPTFLHLVLLVGLVPIVTNFSRTFLCTYSEGRSTFTAEGMCDEECWTGNHITYVVFTSLFALSTLPFFIWYSYQWQDCVTQLYILYRPYAILISIFFKITFSILRILFIKEDVLYPSILFVASILMVLWIKLKSPCHVPWINDVEATTYTACAYGSLLFLISGITEEGERLMWTLLVLVGSLIILAAGVLYILLTYEGFFIQADSFNRKISALKAFFKGDKIDSEGRKEIVTSSDNRKDSEFSMESETNIKFKQLVVTALQGDDDADTWLKIADRLDEWRHVVSLTTTESIHLYHVVVSKVRILPYLLFVVDNEPVFFETCSLLIAMSQAVSTKEDILEITKSWESDYLVSGKQVEVLDIIEVEETTEVKEKESAQEQPTEEQIDQILNVDIDELEDDSEEGVEKKKISNCSDPFAVLPGDTLSLEQDASRCTKSVEEGPQEDNTSIDDSPGMLDDAVSDNIGLPNAIQEGG